MLRLQFPRSRLLSRQANREKATCADDLVAAVSVISMVIVHRVPLTRANIYPKRERNIPKATRRYGAARSIRNWWAAMLAAPRTMKSFSTERNSRRVVDSRCGMMLFSMA